MSESKRLLDREICERFIKERNCDFLEGCDECPIEELQCDIGYDLVTLAKDWLDKEHCSKCFKYKKSCPGAGKTTYFESKICAVFNNIEDDDDKQIEIILEDYYKNKINQGSPLPVDIRSLMKICLKRKTK